MYAIRLDAEILPRRFDTWDEAVEAAQEDYALPPDADWAVVVASSGGEWVTPRRGVAPTRAATPRP